MTSIESQPPEATIPLVRDSELRLAKMRRQLEEMFRKLDLIHDEISVAADAARSNELPELDNMLRLSVATKLFGQLEQLTKVIERLGGKTVLSEAAGSRKSSDNNNKLI
jgi:hypothetical protein